MVALALGGKTQKGSELSMAVEYFRPTSGRVVGTIGVLGSATLALAVVYDGLQGHDPAVLLGAVLFGLLCWAVMLWPRVGVSEDNLTMRNMFDTVTIPLAAIEQLALRTVLAVRVGEKRYVSTAAGRTLRALRNYDGKDLDPVANYADFIEERIRVRMDDARAREGVGVMSDEQLALAAKVRREWNPQTVVPIVLALVGFVLALAL
jgi:hypothetical protein